MSQPFSRFLYPFDVVHRPTLEPEVKRAIFASWASDQSPLRNQPPPRKPPGAKRAVPIDNVLSAMPSLDEAGDSGSQLR